MKRIAIAGLATVLVGLAFIGGGIGLAAAQGEDAPVQGFLGRVAEKLGIGEDELRSAMTEVEQETVDERVDEGLLTPEQGEKLKERIAEGNPLGPRGFHGIRKAVHQHEGRLLMDSAATVLGMEPQDLLSEMHESKTLAQVAEEQPMPRDEFIAALLDEARGTLDQQVADGNLTETQADTAFERLETNIEDIVDGAGCGMSRGPRGGFFGGGPPPSGIEGTETSVQA